MSFQSRSATIFAVIVLGSAGVWSSPASADGVPVKEIYEICKVAVDIAAEYDKKLAENAATCKGDPKFAGEQCYKTAEYYCKQANGVLDQIRKILSGDGLSDPMKACVKECLTDQCQGSQWEKWFAQLEALAKVIPSKCAPKAPWDTKENCDKNCSLTATMPFIIQDLEKLRDRLESEMRFCKDDLCPKKIGAQKKPLPVLTPDSTTTSP